MKVEGSKSLKRLRHDYLQMLQTVLNWQNMRKKNIQVGM